MEKIESKIKSAETIINESHFLAHTIQIFSRKQVIDLIKAAKTQAARATLEHVQWLDNNLLLVHENKLIDIVSIINSPELGVIEVDWAAKCLYNGLLKELE